MFCRNCGNDLTGASDKTCASCGADAVKATSFCRYCGKPTGVQDIICQGCGSAIKPIPSAVKALNKGNPRHLKLSKRISLTFVVIVVTLYIVLSLPPKVTKPIKDAVSDVVVATIGYTTFPLSSLSAVPPVIPPQRFVENFNMPVGVNINATQQLTVYAVFENKGSNNATEGTRLEEVTDEAVYKSSDDKIATVSATGFVRAVSPGSADIIISYTAVPGSANLSAASQGKVPITVSTTVPILVNNTPAPPPVSR